jgi:hypothetical protein
MCDCISEINAQMGEQHNAVLVTTLFGEQKAVINTEKRDSRKRGKTPVMIASFCPFCGEKYGVAKPQDGSPSHEA